MWCVVLTVMAHTQDDPPRHDKYRDDPHAYCFAGIPGSALSEHAHPCSCRFMCTAPDAADHGYQIEDSTCELYCTKTRCACHADQECTTEPSGTAEVPPQEPTR